MGRCTGSLAFNDGPAASRQQKCAARSDRRLHAAPQCAVCALAEVTDDQMTVVSRDRIAMSQALCLRLASHGADRLASAMGCSSALWAQARNLVRCFG
jgi:hypothetical protein